MVNFVKKSDASAVLVVADGNLVTGDVAHFENFPVIVSYSVSYKNVMSKMYYLDLTFYRKPIRI